MNFKEYIAAQLLNQTLHFKCDCLFPMDFIGEVIGYRVENNEIIFKIKKNEKTIEIGENHPKLTIL